jgi:hypothetical protein
MKAEQVQKALALVFLVLGSWCLLFPTMVEHLTFRPGYVVGNATSAVMMGCFGAQAVLCGTLIWFSRFTPRTWLVFGLVGSVPFFGFNAYFYFVERMFSEWMLLDFAGNVAILALSLYGRRLAMRETAVASAG